MGAIAKERGLPEGAADAFEAGIDLLLICESQSLLLDSIELIRDKILKGNILYGRLEKSLERIHKYKKRFLYPPNRISLKAIKEYFWRNEGIF